MHQQGIRLTEPDARRLALLADRALRAHGRDADSMELLEARLEDAEVVPPDGIGPDVVTMNSEVRVTDLDTGGARIFRLVFPAAARAGDGRISILAPLGMAVLGRAAGEVVEWQSPGGVRRLRVEGVLYQPEREGHEVA